MRAAVTDSVQRLNNTLVSMPATAGTAPCSSDQLLVVSLQCAPLQQWIGFCTVQLSVWAASQLVRCYCAMCAP